MYIDSWLKIVITQPNILNPIPDIAAQLLLQQRNLNELNCCSSSNCRAVETKTKHKYEYIFPVWHLAPMFSYNLDVLV